MPTLPDVLYLLAWNGYEDQAYKGSMTCREAREDDRILFPHIINKKFGKRKRTIIQFLADYYGTERGIPHIERLIRLGADPDIPDESCLLHTPFMETCYFGDNNRMEMFKYLLPKVNIHGQGGWPPLALVSMYADCRIKQQLLIDHGADVNRITDGETVLYTVCRYAHEDTHVNSIRFLLDHGADHTIACYGRTPLEVCIDEGHVDIAKLLMMYGASIPDVNMVLLEAVEENNVKKVRTLLACGVCPNTMVEEKPILFHVDGIITPEKAEIIKLLCDAGADVNAKASVAIFDTKNFLFKTVMEPFLYEMAREYIRNKNKDTFAVIKTLIAKGAEPPPLKMCNSIPTFKQNPFDYVEMNLLFMKARWATKAAKV